MATSHIDYNYVLSFRGWALYRMATDPDPDIAPRGVSGYTFALPGEPDLDQIVYFQMPKHVKKRSFCPDIGVRVDGGCFYKTTVKDPAKVAFDGERERSLRPGQKAWLRLERNGPRVIDTQQTLELAACRGVFRNRSTGDADAH